VANALADFATAGERDRKKRTDFVVGVGDNIYRGGAPMADNLIALMTAFLPLGTPPIPGIPSAGGVDDPKELKEFEDKFTLPYAKVRRTFYMTVGNHDWMRNPLAEYQYARTSMKNAKAPVWYMPSLVYSVRKGPVELFALDTTAAVKEIGTLAVQFKTGDLIAALEKQLQASTAKWKIVFGHHPIFNHGTHGHSKELAKKLLPLFVKYKVDAYLAGHQHNQQHLKHPNLPEMDFVVQGASAKQGFAWNDDGPLTQWAWGGVGFSHIKISGETMTIQMIGVPWKKELEAPRALYRVTRTRNPQARAQQSVEKVIEPSCGPGTDRVGANCYMKCRPGYEGAVDKCYKKQCPLGMTSTGFATCQREPHTILLQTGRKNCPPDYNATPTTCQRDPGTYAKPNYSRASDPKPFW
jgi:hypothetical protein